MLTRCAHDLSFLARQSLDIWLIHNRRVKRDIRIFPQQIHTNCTGILFQIFLAHLNLKSWARKLLFCIRIHASIPAQVKLWVTPFLFPTLSRVFDSGSAFRFLDEVIESITRAKHFWDNTLGPIVALKLAQPNLKDYDRDTDLANTVHRLKIQQIIRAGFMVVQNQEPARNPDCQIIQIKIKVLTHESLLHNLRQHQKRQRDYEPFLKDEFSKDYERDQSKKIDLAVKLEHFLSCVLPGQGGQPTLVSNSPKVTDDPEIQNCKHNKKPETRRKEVMKRVRVPKSNHEMGPTNELVKTHYEHLGRD